ncbi:MAG: glycine-rich domain-containing protein [Kiritimatiellia bacterium]
MMNKVVKLVFAAALACCGLAFNAQAASISSRGVDVTYSGAAEAKTLPDGDVVLVFTNTQAAGSFTLPKNAKARVLAVGGGGAGGAMALVDEFGKGAGGGGGAGGVSDHETILYPGAYTVTVGVGGARVQTIVQSWVGANGGNTTLALNGQTLATGKGGGGGGSVKVNGRGEAGGSGGGGSWYGDFTNGGTAVDGQGWAGGKSEDVACGGGGGGAAKTAADGMGRADGTPGMGRPLDITGETVVYGRGGRGGRRDDAWEPLDGAGFGDGGDGAGASGRGGAGAPGVFVVRIHKLFDYTKVDYPEVPSFDWEVGQSYVAFDAARADEPLKSAIDYVEGTTNVVCSLGTDEAGNVVSNGLGRTFYAIHLKDEYVWNDGSEIGTTEPFVAYWRVKEPGTVRESTVEATKTVNWSEGNKATIAINIKTTPEKRAEVPNVLVLGALCGAHGLSSDVFNAALNAITEVGNVDYYYFNENNSKTSVAAALSGSLKKGEKKSGTVYVGSGGSKKKLEDLTGNHGTLYEFYAQLATIIREIKQGTRAPYDYIVFSFDRGLVASSFVGTHPDEATVVEYMKNFYESKSVIWLVDKEPGSDEKLPSGITQTPWFPSPIVYVSGDGYNYWSPLDYYVSEWGADAQQDSPYGYEAYKAEMGLFCPSKYAALTKESYGATKGTRKLTNSTTTANNRVLSLAGDPIAEQAIYDNAANVAQLIANVVVAKPSTISMSDTVYVESGLALKPELTRGQWTTNEALMGWVDLTDEEFLITESGVRLALPGINDPAEIRLFIGVEDTGAFRSSVGATFNEKTGKWEKDPNNGPVTVTVKPDGSEAVLARVQASTAVAWSFPTYTIKGTVVHGEGEVVLNGFIVDTVEVAEGTTPEIVFRGKGGWVLDFLEVDGREIKDFDKDLYNWIFNEVGADHELKVGFKSVFTEPYPKTGPAERVYDGQPAQPTVTTPTFIEGYDYEWKAMYSMESNGVYTADGGEINVVRDAVGNVISTNVYVRIWINQPGYEDGVVIDYWTGCDKATVSPRPITIKYDDYAQTSSTQKTGDFSSSIVSGSLVAGDTLVPNGGQCTSHPDKGGKTERSITAKGDVVITTPEFDGNNYVITVLPGDYYYPDQTLVAKATNVIKVYDGVPETTVVTVLHPANLQEGTHPTTTAWVRGWEGESRIRTRTVTNMTLKVEYSVDGGKTYTPTKPSFTNADEHPITITYCVTYEGEYYTEKQTLGWSGWSDSVKSPSTPIEYTPYVGTATITILPRPVTVIADSAEKEYDGTPLTTNGITVVAGGEGEAVGFITGEGIESAPMTEDSTLTNPGVKSNKIDQDKVTFTEKTNPGNYTISYVDGRLTVRPNPIKALGTSVKKVYDGVPADPIVVTPMFTNGTAFTSGTVYYRTTPDGDWSVTMPATPTDAGEYPIFWKVDGAGYGTVEDVSTITILPRAVTLQAASAKKPFDGKPLTETGFTVVPGGDSKKDGFVGNEGIAAVTMTKESQQTEEGSTPNVIDVYDTEHWTMKSGTKVQNYVFKVLPGTLTVWMQGAALWIIDHEDPGDGWVYLAFEPELKVEEELKSWVERSAANDMIRVKYGETREAADACKPVIAQLSDKPGHAITTGKVWIKVSLAVLNQVTVVKPVVGYWRIFIDCPAIQLSGTGGGSDPGLQTTPGPGLQDTTPPIIGYDGAVSVNMFGILKIESATTNTLIAVPWTWYSKEEQKAENIPVRKLVKTTNLSEGDLLYAWVSDGTYAAWMLSDGDWTPCNTVKIDSLGMAVSVTADAEDAPIAEQTRIPRGSGLWLVRRRPLDEQGRVIPFWIYGQSVTTDVVTTIPGLSASGDATIGTSVSLGSPYAASIRINDLVFEGGVGANDTILVPDGDTGTSKYLVYTEKGWRWSTTKVVGGRVHTAFDYDVTVPAGLAFWYVRRSSGELRIHWPRPQK